MLEKAPAPALWILQPLLSIIHPTGGAKKRSSMPAAAWALNFADAIGISNAEGGEKEEKTNKDPS